MNRRVFFWVVLFSVSAVFFGIIYRRFLEGGGLPWKVVLVCGANSAFHDALRESFLKVAEAKQGKNIEVQVVAVPRLEDSMGVTLTSQEALTLSADCIVTIGRTIAVALVGLARKRRLNVPIVFLGVQGPEQLGLVASLDRPQGAATGVITASFDDSVPARLLCAAFPNVKSILLPFYFPSDFAGEIDHKVQGAKKYFESRGLRVTLLPLDSLSDSLNRVESLLCGHDFLMTVEGDNINDTQFVGMAKLAERYRIGYFAGIMAAAKENVAALYATDLCYIAEAGLEQVLQILKYHKHPSVLPVKCLESAREFLINYSRGRGLGHPIDARHVADIVNSDPLLSAVRGRVRSL